MKTPAEIADHPKARLHRELVETLRASGSTKGAGADLDSSPAQPAALEADCDLRLGLRERQWQLNKIAFPNANAAEVEAALKAGNNLNRLYELACGRASIAKDSAGHFKVGNSGLKIVRHATAIKTN
jgi:hypothetical protein